MALEQADVVWVIVGAVAGGLFLLIIFCLVVCKICRNDHKKSKRKKSKEKMAQQHASGKHPAPKYPDHPLPAGIWTTTPGVFAVTPSEVYAYNSTKAPVLPDPRQYKSGLVERTFSEPSLPREKYSKYQAPNQHSKKQKEVKQLHMTIDDDHAGVHSSSGQNTNNKGEVVARAFSDYSVNRRPHSTEEHTAKAFNNYTSYNGVLNNSQGKPSNYHGERFLGSESELYKRAYAPEYRPMQPSNPIKRVTSHIEKGQRYHLGMKQLSPMAPLLDSDNHVVYSRPSHSGGKQQEKRYSAPPSRSAPQTRTHSLDRRPQSPGAKDYHSAEKVSKKKQYFPSKGDPIRSNFVLKEKGHSIDRKLKNTPSRNQSNEEHNQDNKSPRNSNGSPPYFVSEPAISSLNRGEVPYTVPYDSIDPRYADPAELTLPREHHPPTSDRGISSNQIQHVTAENDPNALYAVSSKVTRGKSQPISNGLNSVTVEAVIEPDNYSMIPSPPSKHADSDGEGLSVKGEVITDSAFAFLASYDDVKSLDNEDAAPSR